MELKGALKSRKARCITERQGVLGLSFTHGFEAYIGKAVLRNTKLI